MAKILYEVLAEMCCREPHIKFRLGFLAWRVDHGRASEQGKTLEKRLAWDSRWELAVTDCACESAESSARTSRPSEQVSSSSGAARPATTGSMS